MSQGLSFAEQLDALVAAEIIASLRDRKRLGMVISSLATHLGFAISVAAEGEGPSIDRAMIYVGDYIYDQAVDHAPGARKMARLLRGAKS